MTVLGIDYGTRWLGLALGNTETKFAFPYKTLDRGPRGAGVAGRGPRGAGVAGRGPRGAGVTHRGPRAGSPRGRGGLAGVAERGDFLLPQLAEICKREGVGQIVLGLPGIWQGNPATQEEIQEFGARLHVELKVPVVFAEEVFTSRMARNLRPEISSHAPAAALILENFFAANTF